MTANQTSRFADDSTFAHRSVTSHKRVIELFAFENLRSLPNLLDQIPPEAESTSITMLKENYASIAELLASAPEEDDVAAAFRDKSLDYCRYQGNVYVILAARLNAPGQDELNTALAQPEYYDLAKRVEMFKEILSQNKN